MKQRQLYKVGAFLMGNQFEISVVADSASWANKCITAAISEIKRIEALLTTYNESSETNLINRNAGIAAVNVSEEIFQLIERSIRISEITQGAFDISYGSIDKSLWNFDTHMTSLPDRETAKEMVRLVNFKNILLERENTTIFLKEKGMRIGFGGIGKAMLLKWGKGSCKGWE